MLSSDLSTFVLSPFLSNEDLLTFACTNQLYKEYLTSVLQQRKASFFKQLIDYFYRTNNPFGSKKFSLSRRYDTNRVRRIYPQYIRSFFHYLPEFFEFMETESINYLDLGVISDYGGYNQNLLNIISASATRAREIIEQFLSHLSCNTTLTYCNLGLFYGLVDREKIINAIEHHPVLDSLNMKADTVHSSYYQPPTRLWRNHVDQTFYWDYWRHEE